MRSSKPLAAFLLSLFLATTGLDAQTEATSGERAGSVLDVLHGMSTVWDYVSVGDYYRKVKGLFGSEKTCEAQGNSFDTCHGVMLYCAINDLPLGGVAGSFISLYGLTDLFKVNCGDGICYACCYVPSNTIAPCHSAFHSEWDLPVINCSEDLYGEGTKEVGMTLVTDPDPQPGQACLFTPQTCDHIPICNTNKTPQQIDDINNDPQHIMKSSGALGSRAQAFGTGMLAEWSNSLSDFHTSAASPSDAIRQRVRPFSALGSFLTGRGCAGWRHQLPASFPTDWSEDQFRIDDATGAYSEEASHFNAVRQLGLIHLMASVPNLFNRLAFVESRIWTPSAITQYLGPIVNPDAVLLQSMSPMALDILKKVPQLQDYRLLAVPLPGETPSPRLFDGCQLADPPAVQVSYQKRSSLGVDLHVQAADSEGSSAQEVTLFVLWGDGSVTRQTVPPGGQIQTLAHDYAKGGRYQVMAVAQNEAGLRTIGALVAETAGTGNDPAHSPVPALSEIQLVDLRARIDSFAGNPFSMMFGVEGWPTTAQGYAMGISRALTVPLNTDVSFGTVAGWNTEADPLPSVTLRPYRFGEGYLFGFQGSYFTLDHLRVGVYSTQDNGLRYQNVPVTASMLRLYPAGSSVPVLLTQPTYDPAGRLKIPVESGGVRYERVDFLFPGSVFTQGLQGPVLDANWTGATATLQEVRPDDGDAALPPPDLDYYTLPPCRLVDTRAASGPLGGPSLQPGVDRIFALAGACGVPADAKALSLDITVTQPEAAGNVRLYPGHGLVPIATVINFSAGATRSNNALMAVAGDGHGSLAVHLESAGSAQLLLDVTGYFQ
jgi:hypothetical protein